MVSVRICTHLCLYTIVFVRNCVPTHLCLYAIVSVRICNCTQLCLYAFVSVRICVGTQLCPYTIVSVRICVSTQLCLYTQLCLSAIVPVRNCLFLSSQKSRRKKSVFCPQNNQGGLGYYMTQLRGGGRGLSQFKPPAVWKYKNRPSTVLLYYSKYTAYGLWRYIHTI